MAVSNMQSAQAQLFVDRLALRQVEERRATVAAALAGAKEALRRARAEIDALEPELETLTTKAVRLRHNVRDQRAIFLRRMFDVLPTELLRAVFLELVRGPDRMWPAQLRGGYNFHRAIVPFAVSGVCRRWRELALATSDLWTYVGLPAIDLRPTDGKLYYRYVLAVLGRSKSRPLDIMLDWFYSGDSTWDYSPFYRHILRALTQHTSRWRRVQIEFSSDTPKRHFSVFRHPTPVLEELDVLSVDDEESLRWSSRSTTYLPYCPSLRRLVTRRIFVAPSEPMQALTFLSINAVSIPITAVEDLLRMTPCLETLSISFPTEPADLVGTAVPAPMALPELVELKVEGDMDFFPVWAACLQVPKLRCLTIEGVEIGSLSAFLGSPDLRISELHVDCRDECRLSSAAAAHLAQLTHLRSITIDDCVDFGTAFFASLAPPCWPHLETIKLKNALLKDDVAETLVQFVRARKRPVPDEPDSEPRAPITVKLITTDVPAWLAPQLRTVAAACIWSYGDGPNDCQVGELADAEISEEDATTPSVLSDDESSD